MAIFAAGAGKYGNYDCCAWQTLGTGQFRPLDGSKPFIGQQGNIEEVEEYLVETFVSETYLQATLAALKKAHPYEEPGYFVTALHD